MTAGTFLQGWMAQMAISSKTEVMQVRRDRGLLMISARFPYDGGHFLMQTIMLAASEANFFASGPVIAHQIERAHSGERSTQPVDGGHFYLGRRALLLMA